MAYKFAIVHLKYKSKSLGSRVRVLILLYLALFICQNILYFRILGLCIFMF